MRFMTPSDVALTQAHCNLLDLERCRYEIARLRAQIKRRNKLKKEIEAAKKTLEVKIIDAYQTTDGKKFFCSDDAKAHEATLVRPWTADEMVPGVVAFDPRGYEVPQRRSLIEPGTSFKLVVSGYAGDIMRSISCVTKLLSQQEAADYFNEEGFVRELPNE